MEHSLMRRPAAEAVGTAVLVLFGAGALVAALRLGGGEYVGLGMVTIAVAVYAFETTADSRINPAVTVWAVRPLVGCAFAAVANDAIAVRGRVRARGHSASTGRTDGDVEPPPAAGGAAGHLRAGDITGRRK